MGKEWKMRRRVLDVDPVRRSGLLSKTVASSIERCSVRKARVLVLV
jgi:hypothetical protein